MQRQKRETPLEYPLGSLKLHAFLRDGGKQVGTKDDFEL
jgi:hypothetical protein